MIGAGGAFPVKAAELFLGNAGTAFRPLTAALALCGGEYRLSGVARMHERPIGDLVDALRGLGAAIDYLGVAGYPPLQIEPALHAIASAKVERARRRIQPVPDCAADGLAAHRPADHHCCRGRTDFQALCGDHAEYDAPLRRRGRARGLDRVHHSCGRTLSQSGRNLGGGRCLVGLLFSRGRCHRRRAGARRGRRARERARRCALRRSPRANGRAHRHGRRTGSRPARRQQDRAENCGPSMPTSITFPMRP